MTNRIERRSLIRLAIAVTACLAVSCRTGGRSGSVLASVKLASDAPTPSGDPWTHQINGPFADPGETPGIPISLLSMTPSPYALIANLDLYQTLYNEDTIRGEVFFDGEPSQGKKIYVQLDLLGDNDVVLSSLSRRLDDPRLRSDLGPKPGGRTWTVPCAVFAGTVPQGVVEQIDKIVITVYEYWT